MRTNVKALPGLVPQWSFADRVRKVRREVLGLTQDEMATELGVGLKAYSAWEAGKNTPADILDMAGRLQKVSGVPREWFIGWKDEPAPSGPAGTKKGAGARTMDYGSQGSGIVTPLFGKVA